MKSLNYYYIINEGLKDSFINIIKNFINHGEASNEKFVTIEMDPKVFGKFMNDKDYFNIKNNNDYPKLVPSFMRLDDMYELLKCELGEDKFGNETTIFTYIGHADFRKNNNKIEVKKEYKDLIEKVFSKYK